MSGYYPGHNIQPQFYNVDPNSVPNPSNPHGPPITIPHGAFPPGLPDNPFHAGVSGPFVQYADPGIQPTYGDQYDETSGPLGSAQGGSARARRRPAPGEQVKHRRTRSGCYTCRQRRVKVNSDQFMTNVSTSLQNDSVMKIIPFVSVSTRCATGYGLAIV
jgi:hypothetical protein